MGEVYRARDPRLRRDVAIKVIGPRLATDPERLRRFAHEAMAAAALNHPHIVAVYDVGTSDGSPYLVTELLEGESLRRRLAAGALHVERAIRFGLQLTSAVSAAHEKGIVHRDLKPENVFVNHDDQLKIVDFGLAKLVEVSPETGAPPADTTTAFTEPGQVLGTAGYMAPEQARGETADHRADVFAIGGILYEMLTGSPAFHRETTAETLTAILREDPTDIRIANPSVSPALARVVAHCLEKQPSQRFQTVRDLGFALETIGNLPRATDVPGASPPRPRWSPWQRVGVVVGAVVLAIGGFVARGLFTLAEPVADEIFAHRLTDTRGLEEWPAISPDGRSVAFVAYIAGYAQLFVRLVGRGTTLQITGTAADHFYPRWSPDSSSLFYYQAASTTESSGAIWEVPALGGGPRRIASSVGGLDISHDGTRLVFPRLADGRMQLVVTAMDGSDVRVLTELEPAYYYLNVRWSFDDRLVAYIRGHTNTFEIFVVPADQGTSRQLTAHGARLDGLTWAPDGSIIFGSSQGSTIWYVPTMNLWRVGIDGTGLRQLTFGESSYTHPDMNGSGTLVAARVRRQFDLWRYSIDRSPTENVQGGVRLTQQTSAIHAPSVAPGDSQIAYVSDSGSHANLWVMDLQARQSRQITYETDPAVRVGLPLWSPDGAHIAYFMAQGSSWNYFVMRPDGSESRLLARNAAWAAWSPDGQWLYFSDYPVGTYLRKVRVSGGEPESVRSDSPSRVAIAADGTLYYAIELPIVSGGSDLEIRVARSENAASRVLARMPATRVSAGGGFQPVLSPDGNWLALALTDSITTNLWALSTSTGELRQLTDFGGQPTTITRRVSWSADGRSIFAAVGEAESDVVLLEGLR